jgi:poly(U)-binding-splicing factor PUF60
MQEASEKAAVSQQSIEASQPIAAVAPSVVRIYGMTEIQLNTRLYVGALHPGINEQHLRLAFSPYGPLKNISLTIDPTTMVHKGFCFVDFDTAEGASMAVERMNGVMLAGRYFICRDFVYRSIIVRPLKIGRPQGYTDEFIRSNPAPKTRLFITNIHEIVTEDDLREMFGGFGVIKALAMPVSIT